MPVSFAQNILHKKTQGHGKSVKHQKGMLQRFSGEVQFLTGTYRKIVCEIWNGVFACVYVHTMYSWRRVMLSRHFVVLFHIPLLCWWTYWAAQPSSFILHILFCQFLLPNVRFFVWYHRLLWKNSVKFTLRRIVVCTDDNMDLRIRTICRKKLSRKISFSFQNFTLIFHRGAGFSDTQWIL